MVARPSKINEPATALAKRSASFGSDNRGPSIKDSDVPCLIRAADDSRTGYKYWPVLGIELGRF